MSYQQFCSDASGCGALGTDQTYLVAADGATGTIDGTYTQTGNLYLSHRHLTLSFGL